MPDPTRPLVRVLGALLVAALTLAGVWWTAGQQRRQRDLAAEHLRDRYAAAVQRRLVSVHHDLDILGLLLAAEGAPAAMPAYLAAKREEFEVVRWLGRWTGSGFEVLLTSPAASAFDPRREPALADAVAGAGDVVAVADPLGPALAVVVRPPLGPRTPDSTLVAVLDAARLVRRSLADLPSLPGFDTRAEGMPLLRLAAVPFGEGDAAPTRPVRVGTAALELAFGDEPPSWGPGDLLGRGPLASAAAGLAALGLWLGAPRRRRRPAGRDLPAEDSRFRALAEASGHGTALVEGPRRLVREIDATFCAMFGVTREQALGAPLAWLVGGAEDAPPPGDLRPARDGARSEWIRLMVMDGGRGQALVVAEDVGAEHRMAARAAHVERLRALGELAGSLRHDIGQPVNVMRLAAEGGLARLDRPQPDPDRLRRSLDTVLGQTARVQALLDQLVATTRRGADGQPRPFRPAEAVAAALRQIAPRLAADRIRLEWHPDLTGPPAFGDPDRLRQAVAAVLENACDAIAGAALALGGEGGRLTVACGGEGQGGTLITIQDEGHGMPKAVLEAIKDPCGRGPDGPRLGLGLTVALGLVAEAGGRVDAVNLEPGTRVDIRLPPSPTPLAPARRPGPRHVLVVDDQHAAAAEIASFLGGQGWRASVAAGGAEAWRIHRGDPADAVVTDLHMPGGDGIALIEQLHASDPLLPIVAVTTGRDEAASRAVRAGAALVLTKPVGLSVIAEELEEMATARS